MLTIDLDQFAFELKEGALKHVGASNAGATAKLYDITDVSVREFGDERIKLVFADDEGNEVQVAVFPAEAEFIGDELARLREESDIFGNELE